ncbi:hypothetical protein CEQ21_01575 [Niallia circulans]|uniref:Integrase SAM-like N-terminal domain-containing protein n=1 Tax=Niallia circulans TaxID=1397 RepID=A0A553SRQ6_NIACI|nr:hypothetical protein CEQ21_01575 [Niallia circulans]
MILSEAWQLYKADKQIQGYSSQTLKAYKIESALFIKHLGNVEIVEIQRKLSNCISEKLRVN